MLDVHRRTLSFPSSSSSLSSDGDCLLLSSCRTEAKLWTSATWERGAVKEWAGCRARFDDAGRRVAVVTPQRRALIYDIASGGLAATLAPDAGAALSPGGERFRSLPGVCFSPTDALVLLGPSLFDPRAPAGAGPIHTFDVFADAASGAFHPAGLEVVLNSEVWDLRCGLSLSS
jgi:HIV-1 Vpr-binding protein